MKRSVQHGLILVVLTSIFLGTFVGVRLRWAHPDVYILTSLYFADRHHLVLDDIDRLFQGNYFEMTWFSIGSGHVFNLYGYFHYLNALFFGYDSRLEMVPVLIAHVAVAVSIFAIVRRFLEGLSLFSRFAAAVLLPVFVFSFVGMGSRGMEFGTYTGIGVSLGIWAVSTSTRGSRAIWIGLLGLQILIVFTALGGYSLGLSATLALVCGLTIMGDRHHFNSLASAWQLLSRSRLYQYTATLILSTVSYVVLLLLFSVPSTGVSRSLSPLGLGRYVVYGNAAGFVNVSVLERWNESFLHPAPFIIGLLTTGLYLILSIVYWRRFGSQAASLIGLLWYGTFLSISISPFRPSEDQMLNTWYGYHHKISLAAAVVAVIAVPVSTKLQLNRRIPLRSTVVLLSMVLLIQGNVIMWYRHPHERIWFQSKQNTALGMEELTIDPATGLTQLLIDLPSSARAIEIQQRYRLSIFAHDSGSLLGVEPDGWLLQRLTVRPPLGKSCLLSIRIESLLGAPDDGRARLNVRGVGDAQSQIFLISGNEFPVTVDLTVSKLTEISFSNVASPESLGADRRPLAARGTASCLYVGS